ncbi:hypothetical protein LT493_26325 [Streptomyces tricolor]|nr:hypothetical protein [Streptomyces tricolor]
MWRTRWWVPDGRHGDQPHPPLLLVFNRIGPRNPNTVIAQLAELTQWHWKGDAYDGFHMYDGKLPIVVTGMKHLQEHGPAGAVFPALRPAAEPDPPRGDWQPAPRSPRRPPAGRVRRPPTGAPGRNCAAPPHSTRPSERPAVRSAPAAAPDSPTHGGRPSNQPGGAPPPDPPAPVRRLQAARHHHRASSRTGRARAPGARPGPARAEGRRHLALPLPPLTSGRGPRPGRIVLPGRSGYPRASVARASGL